MNIFQTKIKTNRGMTYVELIVVLTIFSVMSSIAIYNYKGFQDHIDIRNLSSNIALKIVEAQKSALNGKLPTAIYPSGWKPSYGVYFRLVDPRFIYYTDLDVNARFTNEKGSNESIEISSFKNPNDKISTIAVFYTDGSGRYVDDLSLNFTRPNSSPIFSDTVDGPLSNVSYVQITVASVAGNQSAIKLYASGRVEIGAPAGLRVIDIVPIGPPEAPPGN